MIIDLGHLRDWKLTKKSFKIYKKKVILEGFLKMGILDNEDKKHYTYIGGDIWDGIYPQIVHPLEPEKYPKVNIGSSLKTLLEYNGYCRYEGYVRIYGTFGSITTGKTNIGKIYRVDIFDGKGNVRKILKGKYYFETRKNNWIQRLYKFLLFGGKGIF